MSVFSDQGIRSGSLARLGVDISLIGMALIVFNAAAAIILIPLGIILTIAGLPAVMKGVSHAHRRSSPAALSP